MSAQSKIAITSFVGLFVFSRLQKLLFQYVTPEGWSHVITASRLSYLGLACGVCVFVCLWKRTRAARELNGQPVHWWRWIPLCVATLAYGSEPVVTLFAFGKGFVQTFLH